MGCYEKKSQFQNRNGDGDKVEINLENDENFSNQLPFGKNTLAVINDKNQLYTYAFGAIDGDIGFLEELSVAVLPKYGMLYDSIVDPIILLNKLMKGNVPTELAGSMTKGIMNPSGKTYYLISDLEYITFPYPGPYQFICDDSPVWNHDFYWNFNYEFNKFIQNRYFCIDEPVVPYFGWSCVDYLSYGFHDNELKAWSHKVGSDHPYYADPPSSCLAFGKILACGGETRFQLSWKPSPSSGEFMLFTQWNAKSGFITTMGRYSNLSGTCAEGFDKDDFRFQAVSLSGKHLYNYSFIYGYDLENLYPEITCPEPCL